MSIDCSAPPNATLTVVSDGKTWKMQVPDSTHVLLIGADTFSCSWSKQKVALNYRETGTGAGRVVSIEVQSNPACWKPRARRLISVLLLITAEFSPASSSDVETWKANQDAAARAAKRAHFSEAEKLLLANQKLAETFSSEDARFPRTIFDLAQSVSGRG